MNIRFKRLMAMLCCAVLLLGLLPGAVLAAEAVEATAMYRLYNPNSGEHFYTGSTEERDGLDAIGWNYEGIAWDAPLVGEPVYRVYNPNSGDHHYTMDKTERDWLVSLGWKDENVAWNSAGSNGIPIFRLWNPNADLGSHHYTNSEEERDWLVGLGWVYEGIGWYGVKAEDIKVTLTLKASRTELNAGESATVYFYAAVTGNAGKVQLLNGADNSVVLELKDDGKYGTSGDDLPNDSIYSGKYTIDAKEGQQYSFYAAAGNTKSGKIQLKVVTGFSNAQIQQMQEVDLSIQDDIFEADGYADMTDVQKQELAQTVLEDLSEQGLIEENSIQLDETNDVCSFLYSSGAVGGILLREWYDEQNGMSRKSSLSIEEVEAVTEETEAALIPETEPETIPQAETEATEEEIAEETVAATIEEVTEKAQNPYQDLIDERMLNAGITADAMLAETNASGQPAYLGDAIVLWSFNQTWDKPSQRKPFYNDLEKTLEKQGLDTTIDWNSTIEDYKKLAGYEVIMFSGHGAYVTYTDHTGASRGASILLLSETATPTKDNTYAADLNQYRIAKLSVEGGTRYAIMPDFFTHYYSNGELDGSFVFAENCEFRGKEGAVKSAMPDALLGASAEAVIGFHNSVMAKYARELMETYVVGLTKGYTASKAFTEAKKEHGDDDWFLGRELFHGPTAYPLFSGNKDAKLIGNDIVNGNFEDNATSAVGWKQVGDTRILTQLSSLTPPSKKQMAILTTGIGSLEEEYVAGTEGSVLSQVFNIPKGKTKLVFTYDVVSEEPEEFIGTQFNDTFLAQFTTGDKTVVMAKEEINTAKWYAISNINFDGGDNTTYHTQWRTVEYDISAYAGQTINLQFVVYDMGDSIYDTAALVDNVYLK